MAAHAFKRLHAGIDRPQTAKEWVAKVIDHHWVETLIMFLVVADLVFVAMEVGVDSQFLCLVGKVMPNADVITEEGKVAVGPKVVPTVTHTHAKSPGTASPGSFYEAVATPKVSFVRGAARQQFLEVETVDRAAEPLVSAAHPGQEPRVVDERATGHDVEDSTEHAGDHHGDHVGKHVEAAEVLVCETREGHHTHHIMHVCHQCSIAILCIFMVENLLKLWASPKVFLASWCNKLDLAVVTVSLIIDAAVLPWLDSQRASRRRQLGLETFEFVTFLLVFSRLWRVVRIFHAIFEEYHHVEASAEKPREENAVFRKALARAGVDPERALEEAERKKGAHDNAAY